MLRDFPMSHTGAMSRWLRNKPSGSIKTWEGLKAKFLSKYCPPSRTAKKMKEINNFQQEPDETLYQAWEIFKELLMKYPQHYLTEMQEVILLYNGLEVLTKQIIDSKGAIPTKTAADAKVAIQEMVEYSQKWHNKTYKTRSTKTFDGLAAIQAQLNNLGREIKKVNEKVYSAQVGCELWGKYRAAALGFYQRNNANPLYQERRQSMEESLSKFMNESAKRHEENSNLIKEKKKGSYGPKYLDAYSVRTTLRNDALPRKEKDPRSFTLPCYISNVCFEKAIADLGASISVMPYSTYLNLGLGELAHTKLTVELADRTVKHPKGIAENVLVGIKPNIEEGEVVNEPMKDIVKTRCDFIGGLDDYLSDCDFDRRIHINCAYNLKFLCMMGFEYVHANFLPILPINMIFKKFYYTIMKDKIELKEKNKLGNFVNAPIFIGNFYVITDFTVVEDMDPYLNEGMGNVIVGEPFCKALCVEAKRFDGIITIRDGNDSVTYQMVRSNPRFKHLTNEK
ncbi:hypothetical protein Tco_1123119 [Tanacetum coccineum]|uniref:Retrotransposon gag domain-containing protein n=1 Tax=Tanacetum coccineum TaxID=301880 RepID=A0ABQ5J669_9ASTR